MQYNTQLHGNKRHDFICAFILSGNMIILFLIKLSVLIFTSANLN